MVLAESQTVDGVWGTPISEAAPAAPAYNPAEFEQGAATPPVQQPYQSPIQQPQPSSVWDVQPESPETPAPVQQQPVQPPAPVATPAPDPNEALRSEMAQIREQLAQRDRATEAARQQFAEMESQQQQQQAWDQRTQARNEALKQARYLEDDARETYLMGRLGEIDQQYQADIRQTQQAAQQRLRQTIAQVSAPLWGQELLQRAGLPLSFAEHFKGASPDALEHMIPLMKMVHESQQQNAQAVQQAQASNFNQTQQQYGVNNVLSSNGTPASGGQVKSGSIEHLDQILAGL